MIDENAVKLEARLCAIEFAICELFSAFYSKLPAREIHKRHDQLLAAMRKRGVRGVDPAVSDLLSAEAETALHELLSDLETYVAKPRPGAVKRKP
jgi:hypothetical protein